MINFKTSKSDATLILQIALRASKLAAQHGVDYPVLTADMDLSACHANGNPLDLAALVDSGGGDFGHDVFGIRRHLNQRTVKLEDCFVPRYSQSNRVLA